MTGTKTPAKVQEKAVVKWKGEQISITFSDVKTLICPYATDQEAIVFLKTCQSLQLSPFANEIFLIKYSERDKAATVVSISSYLKAAEVNDNYNGCAAGIILRDSGGKLEFREGAFLLEDEMDKLVGGWARVSRKDRDRDTYMAVNKAECVRYTREGKLTQFWAKEKQASMLRKTALKRSLVEAFPSLFAGTLATTEIADDVEYHEMPEGEVPPAFEKNGEKNWRKFWARIKSELELTTEQARELLQVDSIKDELIDTGWSMEDIWNKLVNALQRQKAAAEHNREVLNGREQIVDTQTGEIINQDDDLEEQLFGESGPEKQPPKSKTKPREEWDKVTKAQVTDYQSLEKLFWELTGRQPAEMYRELGGGRRSDMAITAGDAFLTLKERFVPAAPDDRE